MTDRAWTDDQLSAFLDGELSEHEADALSRELELDPQLAARMERLASANTAYAEAIRQIDKAPPSASLSASLAAAMAPAQANNVVAFRSRSFSAFVTEHRAIAASLLCAAAVWGVMSTLPAPSSPGLFAPGPDGVILASSPLHQMLENAPTGEAQALGSATAVPRLTFASDEGAFCRQFDIAGDAGAAAAIACRKDGVWRTQVVAYGFAKPVGEFQTAAAVRSQVLEAFLDAHMSGAPLNASEEAALLKKRWTGSAR